MGEEKKSLGNLHDRALVINRERGELKKLANETSTNLLNNINIKKMIIYILKPNC